jgi:hypothetical protein
MNSACARVMMEATARGPADGRVICSADAKSVPNASYCDADADARCSEHLAAQTRHVHLDDVTVVEGRTPDRLQQLLAAEHLTWSLHQRDEEVELDARQVEFDPGSRGATGVEVGNKGPDLEHMRGRRRIVALAPAEHGMHPGGQQPGREGLSDVVVCTGGEADQLVDVVDP